MNGGTGTYTSSQLIDACKLLFPGSLIQQGFLQQLHQQYLKAAYRELAKDYHPDTYSNFTDTTYQTAIFRKVTVAYELLSGFIKERDNGSIVSIPRIQTERHFVSPTIHTPQTCASKTACKPKAGFVKKPRNPNDHYYNGPIPTIPLKIGLYLYYSSAVSYESVVDAIIWQRAMRPPFGELASAWGWLDPYFVSVIRSATEITGEFGVKAVHLGLLTESQVKIILMHQKTMQLPLGRYFIEKGLLREYELKKYLHELHRHNAAIATKKS